MTPYDPRDQAEPTPAPSFASAAGPHFILSPQVQLKCLSHRIHMEDGHAMDGLLSAEMRARPPAPSPAAWVTLSEGGSSIGASGMGVGGAEVAIGAGALIAVGIHGGSIGVGVAASGVCLGEGSSKSDGMLARVLALLMLSLALMQSALSLSVRALVVSATASSASVLALAL